MDNNGKRRYAEVIIEEVLKREKIPRPDMRREKYVKTPVKRMKF